MWIERRNGKWNWREVGEGREAGEEMSYLVLVDPQIDLVQR